MPEPNNPGERKLDQHGTKIKSIRRKARAKIQEERNTHLELSEDQVLKFAQDGQVGGAGLLIRLLKGCFCEP
jgi:hypothetical protein